MKNNDLHLLVLMVMIFLALFIFANLSQHSNLGSDQRGYVNKDVYSHYGTPQAKIAIITGMHPREYLATSLVPQVVKLFALINRVEIVDYHVTVTDQAQDFYKGRNNGQALVTQYVTPDIQKYGYQLVIIAHDHEKGYGEGFYLATPTHDTKSVTLANKVHQILPQFNYYPGSADSKAQSSSITQIDIPLAQAGYPVFVYEMPQWSNQLKAIIETYNFFDASFKLIQSHK
jgi:hypothetical protein